MQKAERYIKNIELDGKKYYQPVFGFNEGALFDDLNEAYKFSLKLKYTSLKKILKIYRMTWQNARKRANTRGLKSLVNFAYQYNVKTLINILKMPPKEARKFLEENNFIY